MEKINGKKAIRIETYLVFIFLVLITLLIIIRYGLVFFNSDTASVSIYIREELKEHRFFPVNWYNGNEILIVTPHIVMLPLTLLGIPAYSCRVIADVMILAALTVTVFAFSDTAFADKKTAMMSSLIVLVPFSFVYVIYLDCQASYSMIIIMCCICLTLFLKSTDDDLRINSRGLFILFLGALLFCSLNGLRYVELLIIPLVLALLLVAFEEKVLWKRALQITGGILISAILGLYLFFRLSARYSVWNGSSLQLTPLDQTGAAFISTLKSYAELAGYIDDIASPAARAITLTGSVLFIVMTVVLPFRMLSIFRELTAKMKVYYTFSILTFLITCCSLVFTNILSGAKVGRYFIVPSVFMWSLGCYYLHRRFKEKSSRLPMANIIMIIMLMLVSVNMVFMLDEQLPGTEKRYNDIVSCLEEEGLTFGYASFWNSHVFTVYSNYDTEISPVQVGVDVILPYPVLAASETYRESYHEGDTFLLLTKEEDEYFAKKELALGKIKNKIELEDCCIYVYDHNICSSFK